MTTACPRKVLEHTAAPRHQAMWGITRAAPAHHAGDARQEPEYSIYAATSHTLAMRAGQGAGLCAARCRHSAPPHSHHQPNRCTWLEWHKMRSLLSLNHLSSPGNTAQGNHSSWLNITATLQIW